MNKDDDDLGGPHEEDPDNRAQTSDQLDLNVEQECRSPKVNHVDSTHSNLPSKVETKADGLLRVGIEFESDEHAYRFYNKYARLSGFSVRKDWVNRSKIHGQVVSRKFTCSKEGYRRKDQRDVIVKKHRKETRTGCLAHMIITCKPNGKYLLSHFEANHNHDNINPYNGHALQLQKDLCFVHAPETEQPNNLETQNPAFDLTSKILVRESLDCLPMDYVNHLRSERVRDMKEGEAGCLLHYFQRQHFENPSFFYAIQLDINDKVSNIFWADDNMVVDYNCFGDVVLLDMRFRTNKDYKPFVQFIGVNHHNQALIFSAALLYDDTVESLKWLFHTFLEAMSWKKPKVILTDQDATVVKAVGSILPETGHHICVYQMHQNTLKHLSHIVKDADAFSNDFRSCIYDHNDEDDFIHAWEAMLDKYNLKQNEWLRWMYREKEKWAVVYGKNRFFIDMKCSHLGESLSNKLRSYLNDDQDVLQFFKHFERVMDEQRHKEIKATHKMSHCKLELMGNVILLKHASEIYTPKAFEVFQHDCMKFEYVGFLCSHALRVLDHRNIKVVPSRYILKRWTKDARIGCAQDDSDFIIQENPKLVAARRYRDMCRSILNLSARAAESYDAFHFASGQLNETIEGVEKILAQKAEDAQVIASSSSAATAPDSENVEIFLDGNAIDDQEKSCRTQSKKENEATEPHRHKQKSILQRGLKNRRIQNEVSNSPNTITCISSSSPTNVSPQASVSAPVMQRLFNFEANQVVQCVDQQSTLGIEQKPHAEVYQNPNFYTDQHGSPNQTQLLQDKPLIHGTYHDSVSNYCQLRQAMELDIQPSHSSSFLLYDDRDRTY
ncbi:hypothetical protein Goshw_015470 [Gossypium schwendimanii]|uniref:Protein FAR1-RELATED SEQUENCE n=1 Tax=Gossypium schwendimanii TaxID=34291 RepID=A0A7J9LG61_GOSSC|nr:hypothetical protein [Gossypium schwendimanii]